MATFEEELMTTVFMLLSMLIFIGVSYSCTLRSDCWAQLVVGDQPPLYMQMREEAQQEQLSPY